MAVLIIEDLVSRRWLTDIASVEETHQVELAFTAEHRCRTTIAVRSPICLRCQLHRQLDEVVTGPDGTIPPALLPLREAIAGVDQRGRARSPSSTCATC